MLNRIFRKLFGRNTIFVLLMLAQIALLLVSVYAARERFYIIYILLIVLDVILAIWLVNKKEPEAYKLAWIVTISIFPVFGGITYLFVKYSQKFPREMEQKYRDKAKKILVQDKQIFSDMETVCPSSSKLAKYVSEYGEFPVYSCSEAEYYPLGEIQFEAMLEEMEKAEKFIFMEYFIISDGYMFEKTSEVLIRKAREGLDVRLMFDGIGTGLKISSEPFRHLEENGVKCREFNPFRPFLSSVQNNRDHRKIIIIDGDRAFNGGTNLADEYINRKKRFGHWKDTAVLVRGEAVLNYTVMFLQLWDSQGGEFSDISDFMPSKDGFGGRYSFIQPFSDSPLDNEPVGKLAYMELINNAEESVCITTPYLILDEEMINALGFAAKKGVDVRIITPHIPDKWYVYMIAWINYGKLISEGVKVYEYTPGFIHAKSCMADDKIAVVGTINLDYRSFYLHFESAAILYNCPVISDIKRDFSETIAVSQRITIEDCRKRPLFKKITGFLLNMFAPLM